MKRLVMKPDGWSCLLNEVRPGHFIFNGSHLGFKDEYGTAGHSYNEAGEILHLSPGEIVQAVDPEWEEYDV